MTDRAAGAGPPAENIIAFRVVFELVLAEQARADRWVTLGARHIRLHPGRLAGLDVLDLEIATFSYDRDALRAENFPCRLRRLGHQTHINDLIRDLLLNDQLVLGVHRDLNVVADRDVEGP
jgi:hypothetical protein